MSPRRWLEKWPLRLRVLVLVLGLLQLVAPSWHVCALGGHVLHCRAELAAADNGPVICFCRGDVLSEEAQYAQAWPSKLSDTPDGDDSPFCLARLLQTVPGQAAIIVPPIAAIQEAKPQLFVSAVEFVPQRHNVVTRGRGPPNLC